MEEIIERIASSVGISSEMAEKAVKIIMNFLAKEGADDKMGKLIEAIPGLSDMLDGDDDSEGEESAGGLMGSLLGSLGGSMGGMGAAMEALSKLNDAGLDMDEAKNVAGELFAATKEKLGDETIDELVSSIPGLDKIL